MRRTLVGKKLSSVEAADDNLVISGISHSDLEQYLVGKTVKGVGRKGKYFWLELDETPWLFGHLGMSGWIRELSLGSHKRLHSHGEAPLEDEEGKPKFLKLLLETDDGTRIAFTDGRRLGRIHLAESPMSVKAIKALGFDSLDEMPTAKTLFDILQKRKAPIKAVLLDQGIFAGVGNYLADEALYQAKIAPQRHACTLTEKEVGLLRKTLLDVLELAVKVDADSDQFPETWLFHHRWGGKHGSEMIGGKPIVRDTIGGRTTAWVPKIQK